MCSWWKRPKHLFKDNFLASNVFWLSAWQTYDEKWQSSLVSSCHSLFTLHCYEASFSSEVAMKRVQKLKIKAAWGIKYWGWFSSLFLRGRTYFSCWPSVVECVYSYIHPFWLLFLHLFLTIMTKFYQVKPKKTHKNPNRFRRCSTTVFTWIMHRQRVCRNLIVYDHLG